jgi:hypothetical protein
MEHADKGKTAFYTDADMIPIAAYLPKALTTRGS